jgi:hypothetical protein
LSFNPIFQVDLGSIVQDRFNSTFDEPEEDEDHSLRLEKERLPFAGACGSSDLKVSTGKWNYRFKGRKSVKYVKEMILTFAQFCSLVVPKRGKL